MADQTAHVPCPHIEGLSKAIVVIGGGYAGVTLSVRLGRALKKHPELDAQVVLLEPNPCQQALSELDLVAVGPERPEFCELWLPAVLKDLPVKACFNRCNNIDTERKVVITGTGDEIPYWRAAICTGAIPSVPPVPGLKERAITMWSVADAQKLQHDIAERLRAAAKLPTAEQRREALAITVCGGGATGVEIVGTIAQLLPKRAAQVGLDPDDLRINLVEGRPDILYDLEPTQRKAARDRLEKMGVTVWAGSMVGEATDDAIILADGRVVPSRVICWCGGAKADPHAQEWGLPLDNSGRLCAEPDSKAQGFDDIYVLGDVAAFRDPETHRTLPMLAQFAITEAEHASGNIMAELQGKPTTPFKPNMHGEFVSVGPSWGVGWMFKLKLYGIPAIIMKRMTYILYWWQVGGVKLAWARGRDLLAMQR